MAEEYIKEYQEIGKINFILGSKAANLKIIIRPFKGVKVSVPRSVSIERALKFVEEKKEWIKKGQLKLSRYEKRYTVFDETTQFRTNNYELIIGRHSKSTVLTEIRNGLIKILYPDFADIKDIRIQNIIRKAIHHAWRIEANKYLPERILYLSKQHGLDYQRLTIRDNKSRWGSCSRDNHISLNLHLIRLPQHLSDYVILHELTHTIHKNHQQAFWKYLDSITQGKAKKLDKELNAYSPQIW